jgi:hypothetical protein
MRLFLCLFTAVGLLGCGPNRKMEYGKAVITSVVPSVMITHEVNTEPGSNKLPGKVNQPRK